MSPQQAKALRDWLGTPIDMLEKEFGRVPFAGETERREPRAERSASSMYGQ